MLIRIPLAMLAGVIAYIIAMMLTTYDGVLSMIFQPIMGVLLTGIAVAGVLIIGSPLLATRVWLIWRRFWVVPVIVAIAGVGAMILSWHPDLRIMVQDPNGNMVQSANPALGV